MKGRLGRHQIDTIQVLDKDALRKKDVPTVYTTLSVDRSFVW